MKAEKTIKGLLLRFLNPKEYKMFVFGSRATKKARKYSDFDVGVMGKKPLSFRTLGLMNEALENSDLPFNVDVVDFSMVSEKFKKIALSKTRPL